MALLGARGIDFRRFINVAAERVFAAASQTKELFGRPFAHSAVYRRKIGDGRLEVILAPRGYSKAPPVVLVPAKGTPHDRRDGRGLVPDVVGGVELIIEAALRVPEREDTAFQRRLREIPQEFRQRMQDGG